MDRLSQLRDKAGGSRDTTDSTLDTSSRSEAFLTANSSKYFSLSEDDSSFDITLKDIPIKDVSLASTTAESEGTTPNTDELISNLSPIRKKGDILDSYKIGTQIEAANILSGGVSIFDDNSYDGDELVIDDNVDISEKSELKQPECMQFKVDHNIESTIINEQMDIASKDTEVVLQIDGNNVDAIDIGNGLYLYRKAGQEELAAVQIIDDDQQPSFKFLKVRENAEGNLEVYEEIEIEVPKEVPAKDGKMADKNTTSHVPIKDINKVISDSTSTKISERNIKSPQKETVTKSEVDVEHKDNSPDNKSEYNLNGKMVKYSESRKMTYHSTPNKEGIPLTKTMVDQQLHTNRHSDMSNVKKTIEVHTDNNKVKASDANKSKDNDDNKICEMSSTETETISPESLVTLPKKKNVQLTDIKGNADTTSDAIIKFSKPLDENEIDKNLIEITKEHNSNSKMKQDNAIDTAVEIITKEKTGSDIQIDNANNTNDNFAKIKESFQGPIVENKTDIQVENIEQKSYEKNVQLENIETNKNTPIVHIEDMKEIKDESVVPVEVTHEKDKKAQHNEDERETQLQNVDLKNKEKVLELENIEDDIKGNLNTAAKSFIESKSKTHVGINREDSKTLSMQIDNGNESSFKVAGSGNVKNKSVGDDNIQTAHEEISNVQTVNSQILNEPIIIDDDDVSIVEVIADSKTDEAIDEQKLKLNRNEAMFHNKEGTVTKLLQYIASDVKVPTKVVETTENKDMTMLVAAAAHKKGASISLLAEQEVSKTNAFSSTKNKESKIDVTAKLIPDSKELTKKSVLSSGEIAKSREVIVQQDSSLKTYSNMSKLQNIKITESKYDKKTIEPLQIKDNTPMEVAAKHIPISKLPDKSTDYFEGTKLNPTKPLSPGKYMSGTQKAINISKSDTLKSDFNIVQTSSRKEPVKVNQGTDSRSPDVNNSTLIAIAKIAKEIPRSELPTVKEQNLAVTNTMVKKPQKFDMRATITSQKDLPSSDIKIPSKSITTEKGRGVMNIEISKVPRLQPTKTIAPLKQDVLDSSKIACQNVKDIIELQEKKDIHKVVEPKPLNNNNAAVPFGKWTEANRQEFLSKFKTKTLVISSNSNQLKNSNDLNRRDVLKKIDKQRQSNNVLSKPPEANKLVSKPEVAVFSNKPNIISKEIAPEIKISQKNETVDVKLKAIPLKNVTKAEIVPKVQSEPSLTVNVTGVARTGVVQNLIDKTIEGMINRSAPVLIVQEESKQESAKELSTSLPKKTKQSYQPIEQSTLDEIEMKMNELHGIPFIERPPHELPQVINPCASSPETKTYSKVEKQKQPVNPKTKVPNLLPYPNKNQPKCGLENVIDIDSEDEIIEHEPITGDIELEKKSQEMKQLKHILPCNNNSQVPHEKLPADGTKKETVITEKDFDRFARRNSITYENRSIVNFESKETRNVNQTVADKGSIVRNYSKKDQSRLDPKTNHYKHQSSRIGTQTTKVPPGNKLVTAHDDASNRNQSKLQKAYHSVLTAKRQKAAECPITIIEDKPVKVVFMENIDYVPSQLNVQGQDLSPAKRTVCDSDLMINTCDSVDLDILDSMDDTKLQDEIKSKTKHQRKQVLTPVDEPELEVIEPSDMGIELSPKKKRKSDEESRDKGIKYPMRKKLYLLGSNITTEEKIGDSVETMKNPIEEVVNIKVNGPNNPVSALDSLVKAAELIETQTDNSNKSIASNPSSQSSTPVKRGRGRPRKYPLTPDGEADKSKVTAVSPQKKPRLIDAKVTKRDNSTDDSDSEGEIIKENWTMGKINENIVCPICNKLFRTENVVFKHVKHCTGPSPSRSDSDKRSLRKMSLSHEFDTKCQDDKSDDMDIDDDLPLIVTKETSKKHTSNKVPTKSNEKDDTVAVADAITKEKLHKVETEKLCESSKSKIPQKNISLVCEFCGCKFRQLSYLAKHIILHHKKVQEKTTPKKTEKDAPIPTKSTYCCEVCKKEFRKLHHLVQHRIIHNPNSVPAKSLRKSSSEQSDNKIEKQSIPPKPSEDQTAGFRCEPCDKSFRKLHHLVEHRETHDGINRQKNSSLPTNKEDKPAEKPVILHQCDVCKKTFKKLQYLNEHKEQHMETSSEKSDDKSVKSCLSTRDIIHECSLCYMVFPNEHSLNKHIINCQRKKRQRKQQKPTGDTEDGEEVAESPLPERDIENIDSPKCVFEDTVHNDNKLVTIDDIESQMAIPINKDLEVPNEELEKHTKTEGKETVTQEIEEKVVEQQIVNVKKDILNTGSVKVEVSENIKKVEEKELVVINETPKKKTVKNKTGSASKRLKATGNAAQPTEDKITIESSDDDDDVRYMLNPNFKGEDITEEKTFMKVRATKRNSLQIERPNSKELVKRRTSLQHPPKIPRLKSKSTEPTMTTTVKKEIQPKLEPVPSTDSDDSETTKYSFPVTMSDKSKSVQNLDSKTSERKSQKNSLGKRKSSTGMSKRKSLTGIAKRKSLKKTVTAKQKALPVQQVRKRTLEAEHRCDCGQLFSSAALLSRHTTLAHTPPRIRRKRSPPPEDKPVIKPAPRKSITAGKPKQTAASRKSSASSSASTNPKSAKTDSKSTKKALDKETKIRDPKKMKTENSITQSNIQLRRTGTNRGASVAEKLRKQVPKNK